MRDENREGQIDDLSHAGERNVVAGLVQLVVVCGFVFASFSLSAYLEANKTTPAQRAGQDRVLLAEVARIAPGPFRVSFDTTGLVQARSDIAIIPQVSGRVVAIDDAFFKGGGFKTGAPLFEIEPLDFKLEVERLEAVVAQAQTNLDLEIAESEAALAEWAQIHGEKPAPDLVARKPQKREAEANLKAAKAQLGGATLDLERTKFTLPFAGRVLESALEVGQHVTAGQSYGSVYKHDRLEIEASLEGQEMGWLMSAGEPSITIKANYLDKVRHYRGVFKRGVASLDNQTRFAQVHFGFEDSAVDIVPGVFVDLHIKGPRLDDVVMVPHNAVQKGGSIWAVDEDDTLFEVKGDEVFSDEEYIVLRDVQGHSGALDIVVSKMPGAMAGMDVEVTERKELAKRELARDLKREFSTQLNLPGITPAAGEAR